MNVLKFKIKYVFITFFENRLTVLQFNSLKRIQHITITTVN